VGAVNYLNTKPLIYGFEKGMMKEQVDLIIDYPSKIAAALLDGSIDIGLVPVAILPKLKEYHFVSDYAIACDGTVASVCLFSDVPLEEIETVLLDYQSQTSVALLKILLKEYWKISPKLLQAAEGYEISIKGNTAGLVRLISMYSYDLGLAWKIHTGLPFVFAAWISSRPFDKTFVSDFNASNAFGINNIDLVIGENPFTLFDLLKYYSQNIKFRPDFNMGEVITLFLGKTK
jgi:chorismate dehydratase